MGLYCETAAVRHTRRTCLWNHPLHTQHTRRTVPEREQRGTDYAVPERKDAVRLENISIGKITGTHGTHGEVRVFVRGIPPDLLFHVRTIRVNRVPMTVESVRMHKGRALVKLQGVDTIDAALALRDGEVSIARDDAAVPPDYYFDDELLGMRVYDENGNDLGELILGDSIYALARHYGVPESEIQRVNNIHGTTIKIGQRLMIPAVKDVFIRSVNLDENRMEVHMWEGL